MKKLITLLAAVGAVVFFWRKKHRQDDTAWSTATEPASGAGAAPDASSEPAGDAGDVTEDVDS